jgi:hypothetical protein
MPRLPRRLAIITTCALSLSAAPALVGAAPAHADPVKANTVLVAKIQSASVGIKYSANRAGQPTTRPFLGQATSLPTARAAQTVAHVPADSAQLPAKLEWLLGVDLQVDGDLRISEGARSFGTHHPAGGRRLTAQGLADYRLSNYYIGQADTLLGVRHPTLSARPYRAYKDLPVSVTPVTPTVSVTAKLSLTTTIRMGDAAIEESIPEHVYPSDLYSLLGPNETACQYYSLLVSRMHVPPAQRAAQREWAAGVSAQRRGETMIFLGLYAREPSRAADGHEADAGLVTLRHGDSEIAHADATLGIHQSGPSARLPPTIILGN